MGKHWTKNIDVDEALKIAEILNIEPGTVHGSRSLIEKIMVTLMKVIREPWFVHSAGYDEAVDFYQTCQRAVAVTIGRL